MRIEINTVPKSVNFVACKGSEKFCKEFLARKLEKLNKAGFSIVGHSYNKNKYETLISNKTVDYTVTADAYVF